jgi:hypothetical protein
MLRFLVVGTLRCGTGYTAQVLNRAGIACGHGWIYSTDRVRLYPEVELLGDASPLAAPSVRDFDGLVLHQVRDPLKVIGSLLGSARTRNPMAEGAVGAFLARHGAVHGDPIEDAMGHYVEWNARCERHNGYLRYRIEELDAGFLLRIADLIGQTVDAAAVARAFEAVPTNFNTRYPLRQLSWSDLPEGSRRDALRRLAGRYGYPYPAHDARAASRA